MKLMEMECGCLILKYDENTAFLMRDCRGNEDGPPYVLAKTDPSHIRGKGTPLTKHNVLRVFNELDSLARDGQRYRDIRRLLDIRSVEPVVPDGG